MPTSITRYLCAIAACLSPLFGHAQPLPGQDWNQLRLLAAEHLAGEFTRAYPDARTEIQVGEVDKRLYMPQCSQLGFFLPTGSQLFGAGTLGARCVSPAPWTLYLTYSATTRGPALVARSPLLARQTILAKDVESREVLYERPPGNYLRQPGQLDGVMAARPIQAGQAITLDRITRQPSIKPGQKVRIIAQGSGFRVSQEGVAQNAAQAGDVVRVKTASGRILHGQATAEGTVLVQP